MSKYPFNVPAHAFDVDDWGYDSDREIDTDFFSKTELEEFKIAEDLSGNHLNIELPETKKGEYMNYKIGTLGFNVKNGRFGMLICDLWENEGFHCGECFDIWDYDKEKWIPTRIEKAFSEALNNWYLVGTGLTGSDLEGLRIRIAD